MLIVQFCTIQSYRTFPRFFFYIYKQILPLLRFMWYTFPHLLVMIVNFMIFARALALVLDRTVVFLWTRIMTIFSGKATRPRRISDKPTGFQRVSLLWVTIFDVILFSTGNHYRQEHVKYNGLSLVAIIMPEWTRTEHLAGWRTTKWRPTLAIRKWREIISWRPACCCSRSRRCPIYKTLGLFTMLTLRLR